MGKKYKLFITITVAGMTAGIALASSQSNASPMLGPKPSAFNISPAKSSNGPGQTASAASLSKIPAGSNWGPLKAGIGKIRVGSNPVNWTDQPNAPRRGMRSGVKALSLGTYDNSVTSFNGDTAIVDMESDRNWRASTNFFGTQYKERPSDWSNFHTNWTGTQYSGGNAEWSENYSAPTKYRMVSEFCSADISKDSGSLTDCGGYSGPLLSVLRVVNTAIAWIRSLLGSNQHSA